VSARYAQQPPQRWRTQRGRVLGWLSYYIACRARQPSVTHVGFQAPTRWVSPSVSGYEPRAAWSPLFGRTQAAADPCGLLPPASRAALGGRLCHSIPCSPEPPTRVAPVKLERSVCLLSPGARAVRVPQQSVPLARHGQNPGLPSHRAIRVGTRGPSAPAPRWEAPNRRPAAAFPPQTGPEPGQAPGGYVHWPTNVKQNHFILAGERRSRRPDRPGLDKAAAKATQTPLAAIDSAMGGETDARGSRAAARISASSIQPAAMCAKVALLSKAA